MESFSHHIDHQSTCSSKTSTPQLFSPTPKRNNPFQTRLDCALPTFATRSTIDRIVLVPDQATFLAAIEHWSLKGRWPILIEDEQYTPMFIRRFHLTR